MVTSLYHPRYKKLSQSDLAKECERDFSEKLKVTSEESKHLAESTRLQAQSHMWFEHRKDRLIASKFRAICHTSISKPSQSLVAQILQLSTMPKSAVLSWGITNEKKAREQYWAIQEKQHTAFKLEMTGLCINPSFPHLGASPDGLISCKCCGLGLLEIKCPYSIRHTNPDEAPYLLPLFFRLLPDSGPVGYPAATSVWLCLLDATWYPHWTNLVWPQLFYRHLYQTTDFFVHVILPHVLCGTDKENTCYPSENTGIFCYCRKGEVGKIVLCDNPSCKYGWFHFSCVNLKSTPEGAWFCPDCKTVAQ